MASTPVGSSSLQAPFNGTTFHLCALPAVLGRSVAFYTRRRTPINSEIVSLGVDTYLGMLLEHNFVHTDLHPGEFSRSGPEALKRWYFGS